VTPIVIALVVVVAVAVVAVVVAAGRRRRPDDIASFRRQIDALSPEARRETTDRMKPPTGSATDEDGANGT
jgi:hypothetical protein